MLRSRKLRQGGGSSTFVCFLVCFFSHQRISQRVVRGNQLHLVGGGGAPVFLRKHLAICDFPGVSPFPYPPYLPSCSTHATIIVYDAVQLPKLNAVKTLLFVGNHNLALFAL